MKHLRENNETYFSHLMFAVSVGLSLISRGVLFIVHGLIPIIRIPRSLNLMATIEKLEGWSRHADSRRRNP